MITSPDGGDSMKKQQFQCVPGAVVIPAFFFLGAIVYFVFFVQAIIEKDLEGVAATSLFICIGLIGVFATSPQCFKRVEILSKGICCKGVLPQSTFMIDWGTCNIGMDYHYQSGRRVWWIYVCTGSLSNFMPANKRHKINSAKITPGFIRIVYSDKVYTALLEVLPKKQQTALISARRCAGL